MAIVTGGSRARGPDIYLALEFWKTGFQLFAVYLSRMLECTIDSRRPPP